MNQPRILRSLPNFFSVLRLVLAPFIARAILGHNYKAAFLVFVAAGCTDMADGFFARRLDAVSRFGAYADPIADKVLLSTVYVCLGVSGALPWWLVGIVFGRDLVMMLLSAGILLFTDIRRFSPSVWGKASTFFQIVAALAAIVDRAWPAPWSGQTVGGLIWIAAAATLWSGFHYAWRTFWAAPPSSHSACPD